MWLLLGLALIAMGGFVGFMVLLAWLVRKWIAGHSYLGQFDKIVEAKARMCGAQNGAKT